VLEAAEGSEALRMIGVHATKITALLIDVTLPRGGSKPRGSFWRPSAVASTYVSPARRTARQCPPTLVPSRSEAISRRDILTLLR
jgi:hypothetical protein